MNFVKVLSKKDCKSFESEFQSSILARRIVMKPDKDEVHSLKCISEISETVIYALRGIGAPRGD